MNAKTDQELVRAYALENSEEAFAELVRRHVHLVYSVALRLVVDPHLAEDVTQGTFIALVQNARKLAVREVLSSWLHLTARNLAAKLVRTEERRRAREKEAVAMETESPEPEQVWSRVALHLDEAIGCLSDKDRDALMLRFFERKSAQDIALVLDISAEAAQKRVSRAVERLRELFAKRGVTIGASGLVAAVSANAVQAAPVGLDAMITTSAALAGTTLATTITATKAIAMTTLQKTLITAVIAAAVGTGIYEARQASTLRSQVQTLQQEQQQQQSPLSNLVVNVKSNVPQASEPSRELLRLRGEVGVLRQQTNELGGVRKENIRLSQAVAESETNQVSPEDELIVRQNHAVDAMTALLQALKTYATNHNGQYPANLDQLVAAGDLKAPKLAGNLGPSDFEFGQGLGTDPQGNETILRLRVPITKPGGGGVMVVGGINDAGVSHTSTWNVSP
jgi:RNA polymerase sigma factor (sigma-70 family)